MKLDNTKQYLIEVPLPEATDSYTVIPHEMIMNLVTQIVQEKGFEIIKESYKQASAGKIATGLYYLNHQTDPDLGLFFTWTNSYDKSLRFKCFVGAYVLINENVIISDGEEGVFKRKHTGTADTEVQDTIKSQLENALSYYEELIRDKEIMRQRELSIRQFAELLGRLYIEERFISSEQISYVHGIMKKPKYDYGCSETCVWTLYNHILGGLIKCHPSKWVEQQRIIHLYLKNELQIGVYKPISKSKAFPTEADIEKELEKDLPPAIDLTPVFDVIPEVEIIEPVYTGHLPKEIIPEIIPEIEVKVEIKEEPETVVQPVFEVLPRQPITESDVINEIDITLMNVDKLLVLEAEPSAQIGSVIEISEDLYIIEDETDTEFFLRLHEEVQSETPVITEELVTEEPLALEQPTANLSYKDIQIIPGPLIADQLRESLSQYIFDLYSKVTQFEVEVVEHEYNILLSSGESCCVDKKQINKM